MIIRNPKEISELLAGKIVGKTITKIDLEEIWTDNDGHINLENVTTIHLGDTVLVLSSGGHLDDYEVDIQITNETEKEYSNSDGVEYKKVWITE